MVTRVARFTRITRRVHRVIAVLPAFALASTHASASTVELLNVSSSGQPGNGNAHGTICASGDGRLIAYDSAASNLVAGDGNGALDVFLHDRDTGQVTRISESALGGDANGPSYCPVISLDGRFVTFTSAATDIVPGDTNGATDVFLHDRAAGTTILVSVAIGGGPGDQGSYLPTVSADGRYVAFESLATDLVPADANGKADAFVRDVVSGTTSRISVGMGGVEGDDHSGLPYVAANGRHVAYLSSATNLVPGDVNGNSDMFRHDLVTGETVRVSVSSSGGEAHGDSWSSAIGVISPNGRFIGFWSEAADLVPNDTNGVADSFLRDVALGTTTRVSVSSAGVEGDAGSYNPIVSSDGRYVVFDGLSTNLVPGDTNGVEDVFIRDLWTSTTRRVSVAEDGSEANNWSYFATMTPDARLVLFSTAATNLGPTDSNGFVDVVAVAECWVEFQPFGAGLAGSSGFVPALTGANGSCWTGGHSIAIANAVGGAFGLLFVGLPAPMPIPALGGLVHVDLAGPLVVVPLTVGGIHALPGDGTLAIPGADVRGLEGVTVALQYLVSDPGATQGTSMTNGLLVSIVP